MMPYGVTRPPLVNTLRLRQNGCHFADNIFKCIFLNENIWIPIKISLKFVPKGSINIIPALVQMMAWRRPGDKPLSEPMMVNLPMHICVTRPQWVKQVIANACLLGYETGLQMLVKVLVKVMLVPLDMGMGSVFKSAQRISSRAVKRSSWKLNLWKILPVFMESAIISQKEVQAINLFVRNIMFGKSKCNAKNILMYMFQKGYNFQRVQLTIHALV